MKLPINLTVLESCAGSSLGRNISSSWKASSRKAIMDFHVADELRKKYGMDGSLFSIQGNVILSNFSQVRELTQKINGFINAELHPEKMVKAGQLNAMGIIDEILHYVCALYREKVEPRAFDLVLEQLEINLGKHRVDALLKTFSEQFPPREVYTGNQTVNDYLSGNTEGEDNRSLTLEELLLLAIANLNPAFEPFHFLFDDADLTNKTVYPDAVEELKLLFSGLPSFGPDGQSLWDLLRAPALASDTLSGQLEFMRKSWGLMIADFIMRLLMGMDVMKEEEKPVFFGPGPSHAYVYNNIENEYERFSPDQDWMPRTVLMAKSTLVWLFQLTQKYGYPIDRLDQIPDEELDELAQRGFTGLWLIGLWERSNASKTIKQWTGNPEAAASAYSLHDYDIAGELGGWGALTNLRDRCAWRGIKLGSDMVPNHTGIDSRWVMEHPDRFLQLRHAPFPTYTFNGGNLSSRDGVGVYIEDHYYNRTDAAVVFKRIDFNTGDVRYIYHGNDGTSMPWNDTAQIDFLNPEAREAVISTIVGVCKQFPIVRFDAAMTLAKRHIQRLWYPEPGRGGDIASRAEHAISAEEFNRRIPEEFWREVVDRCAAEAPGTLLLAEAFWMMEGYFVRTLGMHRVYNSAFMNMLKNEENGKYRATIINTLEFDPEILKRFVNFMNNPDEDTAVAQFGKGDKYFGICTLLVTMPGLPMFGHGQIEGYQEKYGMEYRRSYHDETPDAEMISRHDKEIFPLMKRRSLFSGSADFVLYDMSVQNGPINENVFVYSNQCGNDRSLVLYNNIFVQAAGWIYQSAVNTPNRKLLAEAFGLHNSDKHFVLLWEQRSEQWFIRSSKEIFERGLFAALNGYQAQVFLNIHEVEDGKQNRWAKIHHELEGKGCADIYAALQDMLLKELYEPFCEILSKENLDMLYQLVSGEEIQMAEASAKSKKPANRESLIQQYLDAVKDPIVRFIKTAELYLDGASGKYDPFISERVSNLDTKYAWKNAEAYLLRLINLESLLTNEEIKKEKTSFSFIDELIKTMKTTPQEKVSSQENTLAPNAFTAIAFAAGYGLCTLLRDILGEESNGHEAKLLMDHWNLDRKFRELYQSLEVPAGEAWRVVEMFKALLKRTCSAEYLSQNPKELAKTLAEEALVSSDYKDVLGLNQFDNAIWFNKECFDDALFYASLFVVLEKTDSEKALITRIKETAEIVKLFQAAEKVSGYKLEDLCVELREEVIE
ncbi:MAG: alpha-amylase [Treponema sp.]|jgi:hypothetical protein|nr:alpha-amylase [Treponema sp.]